MFSRPGRQTHSDRPGEDEAQEALRPRVQRQKRSTPTAKLVSSGRSDQPRPSDECPATEAINSNRQTGVQREKGLSLQPPDVGRERRAYHSVHRPVLLAKGLITPHRQHPSWATCSVHPGLEGRTPRFLGRETLEKPETASIITATGTRWKGLT